MFGAASVTVMLTVALADPPLLLPQIVYVLSVIMAVGVPQMVPLLVPKERPLGSAGEMAQEVMAPGPAMVGASGRLELVVFFLSVRF